MQSEVWKRVEELFHAAKSKPPAERSKFLLQACPEAEIRMEVQTLLDAESSADSFLESSPMLSVLAPGARLGHFDIQQLLGRGGMGDVYRAWDKRLNRNVAIKTLQWHLSWKPKLRERFEREARAISALNHPNVCTLYDIGREDSIDFLVMEYCEGQTLANRLRKGPLPIDQTFRYAIEMADALATAHRQGVLHRDLKPSNIMLTKSGAKLLDFGLAKIQTSAAGLAMTTPASTLTEEGLIWGTLQYMAPEQLQGKDADARTDIFAFGTVLYEMATGQKAFQGESRARLIAAILEHEPEPPSAITPAVPAALERVVQKCLAKEPDARWQTARDLKDELEWIAGQSAVSAPGAPLRRKQGQRLTRAAAGFLALIAILLALLLFRQKAPKQRLVSFSIYPPDKATFSDPLAISPDGTRLAFVARAPGAEPSLWTRRLDSLAVQPLPGTEGGDDPFWSPDGQFIGFFTREQLKTIDLSTGVIQTLCEAHDQGHGTWNREGVILFAGNNVLYRVPADGGLPTRLTLIDQGNEQFGRMYPYFLPDGRHFLYTAFNSGRHIDAIYIGSLDSKETKRIVASHWMAVYAPVSNGEGYLLFVRDGNLMAQRFDSDRLDLTGAPVLLTKGISDLAHTVHFSSSTNGTLAYRAAGVVKTELTWFDRAGKKVGILGLPMQDLHGAISPDGRRVAVSRGDSQSANSRAMVHAPSAPSDIWIIDLQSGDASRLTSGFPADYPVWSPDGSRIAYTSDHDGIWDLYQKPASGVGVEELLVKSNEDKLAPDFSRDGRFLTYASYSPKTNFDIWVLPLEGDRTPFPFIQTRWDESTGSFSPDGQWMVYRSSETWEPGGIYARPFRGNVAGGKQSPAGSWPIATDNGQAGQWPHWRGDGKELFYVRRDDSIMAITVATGRSKSQPTFQSGIPKPLFNVQPYGLNSFAVTSDGQRFLVNTRIGEEKPASVTVILDWPVLLREPDRGK